MAIPWTERINAISINPTMATLEDIAKMAAELIDYKKTKSIPCTERQYTSEEAEKLKGKMVICDELTCDGKRCDGYHKKPHIYNDEECFHNCEWPGHNGFCIPVENLQRLEKHA